MGLTRAWKRFSEKFLTRIRCIAAAAAICVTSNVSVGVTDVVFVFFLELVVCNQFERASPEYKTFIEAQTDALQEQGVL